MTNTTRRTFLTQENRSFDHYFGTMPGVRGFGDRFPIPVRDAIGFQKNNVWCQVNEANSNEVRVVAPFRLDTETTFPLMRVRVLRIAG